MSERLRIPLLYIFPALSLLLLLGISMGLQIMILTNDQPQISQSMSVGRLAPPEAVPTKNLSSIAAMLARKVQSADLTIGYYEDDARLCMRITNIVEYILKENYGYEIQTVRFQDRNDMYRQLTGGVEGSTPQIDFTTCYVMPDDKKYMLEQNHEIVIIEPSYREISSRSFHIAAHRDFLTEFGGTNACIPQFLQNIDFGAFQPNELNNTTWVDDNASLVRAWTHCDR